jgi:uncharacterized protein YggT (Ycf19 family)
MMERKERVQVIKDDDYARRERVVEYKPDTRNVAISRINQIIWLIAAIICVLFVFRFGLMLIAANPGSGFVDFIYSVTNIFVTPFNSILAAPTLSNGGVIDVASLFAIMVYLLATWLIVTLISTIFTRARRVRNVSTIERERDT